MNSFLESKDISPVRFTLKTPWSEANERTRRRHTRKAKQVVVAVLDEVAPNQFSDLWTSVISSVDKEIGSGSEEEEDVDAVMLGALVECYQNADSWGVRRQILSIMAGQVKYSSLKKWIPDLTRYRFSKARKHALVCGKGVPVPQPIVHKTRVPPTQLDHFLDFITSPHIIQDLPFGEKSIKLSSKEVLTVPNVIRTMIPETIVRQYKAFADETGFTSLSRTTLLRILNVCSASVRKSLQGLDYFSAAGAEAFDNLISVVEQLGEDLDLGMSWAKEQSERLKSAKQYLKSDYKVS